MSDRLSSVLNEAVIERLASPRLASPRSFGRGVGYFEEGRVGPLRAGVGPVRLARRLLLMTTRPQQGASVDVVSLCALIDQTIRPLFAECD
jgi:hypothetical protein